MVHKKFFIDLMEFSQNTITWEKGGAENTVYKSASKDVSEEKYGGIFICYHHWGEILQVTV